MNEILYLHGLHDDGTDFEHVERSNSVAISVNAFHLVALELVGRMRCVTLLDMNNNALLSLPSGIECLANLQELYIMKNALVELDLTPVSTTLIGLYLRGNSITRIDGLSRFSKLERLMAGENKFTSVPQEVDNLLSLTDLDFGRNQLTATRDLSLHTNLQKLRLQGNQLTRAPNYEQLVQLQLLHLSSNQLTEVSSVRKLSNLKELWMLENQLTSAPDGLEELVNLEIFYMRHNKLTSLPSLSKLTHLKEFGIRENRLTAVPHGLELLTKLEILVLSNNNFQQFPDFSVFPKLETLYAHGNPAIQAIRGVSSLTKLNKLKIDLDMLPVALAEKGAPLQMLFDDELTSAEQRFADEVVRWAQSNAIERRTNKL